MPRTKKQILRMVKLVAEMRRGAYPNCTSFAEMLREADLNDNLNMFCGPKTIQRDIQALKEEFHAPIVFDSGKNGYCLTSPEWEFTCPILQDEHILALLFSTKVARDIAPPLRNDLTDAVNDLYTTNAPDFLDKPFLDSLFIAAGVKVKIDPGVFRTVFTAWHKRLLLDIEYTDGQGKISSRLIEPHSLNYFNSSWYVKGFCHAKNDVRMFAVHRIKAAKVIAKYFEPNPEITKPADPEAFFDGERVNNVRLHFVPGIARRVMEQTRNKDEIKEMQPDGSVIVTIPSVVKFTLLHWILASAGDIRIIEPESVKKEAVEAARKVIRAHE